MSTMTDSTQSALSALRHLRPADRAAAAAILSMWAHRDEVDIQRVVDYYFAGGPAAVVTTDARPQEGVADESTPFGSGYAQGYVDATTYAASLNAATETVEVADGHQVHTCCGKLDDQAHRSFCRHFRALSIVDDAVQALSPFRPTDREHVLSLLRNWGRALSVYDVVAIQDHFFPIKLIDPPACPAWCDGTHGSEDDGPEFRDCTSEGILFPVRTDLGTKVDAVQVNAIRSFDKRSGKLSRPLVQMEDYDLTAREARALAAELARAAELIDGDEKGLSQIETPGGHR